MSGHREVGRLRGGVKHPSDGGGPIVYRGSSVGDIRIIKALIATEQGQELLRKIHGRADHPDEARAFGAAGRKRAVETYAFPLVVDHLEELYERLGAPARGRPQLRAVATG